MGRSIQDAGDAGYPASAGLLSGSRRGAQGDPKECGILGGSSQDTRGHLPRFEVGDRGGGGGGDGAQAVHEATATPQRLLRSPRPLTARSPSSNSFAPRAPIFHLLLESIIMIYGVLSTPK